VAWPAVTEGLQHSAPQVRKSCARVLAELGPFATFAAAPLDRLLDDADEGVRCAAAFALLRLSGGKATWGHDHDELIEVIAAGLRDDLDQLVVVVAPRRLAA